MPKVQQGSMEQKSQFLHYIDLLLDYCIKHKISDLHFEAQGGLRLRKNLALEDYHLIPKDILKQISQRFKILANLDIAETRLPQDGQFVWKSSYSGKHIPCRINCCPTIYGPKIVIRLLSSLQLQLKWNTIGLPEIIQHKIEYYCAQRDGLILICGPTGSGKTTTLYALLEKLNNGQKNIISIEDPVEIPYLNFTQVEVQNQLGFSISQTLRTVLRQDPDIIMIGEIRDEETAKLCFHAAQTGHIVLSSLHAPSPKGAILRLKQLGIEYSQLSYYLKIIVSQHLIAAPYSDEKKLLMDFDFMEISTSSYQE